MCVHSELDMASCGALLELSQTPAAMHYVVHKCHKYVLPVLVLLAETMHACLFGLMMFDGRHWLPFCVTSLEPLPIIFLHRRTPACSRDLVGRLNHALKCFQTPISLTSKYHFAPRLMPQFWRSLLTSRVLQCSCPVQLCEVIRMHMICTYQWRAVSVDVDPSENPLGGEHSGTWVSMSHSCCHSTSLYWYEEIYGESLWWPQHQWKISVWPKAGSIAASFSHIRVEGRRMVIYG